MPLAPKLLETLLLFVGYRFTVDVRRTARQSAGACAPSRAQPFQCRLSRAGNKTRLQDGAWVLGRDPESSTPLSDGDVVNAMMSPAPSENSA